MSTEQQPTPKAVTRKMLLVFCIGASMASFGSWKTGHTSKKDEVLDQETRRTIYELIRDNAGLHFRKICRLLDKKMGVVQYHVSVLEKNNLIRSIRDGRYKCFFATENDDTIAPGERSQEDQTLREQIITSLRRKTPKILIEHLARENIASHQALSNQAGVSPQAITFHTQRLSSFGIIESQKEGRQKFYTLSPKAREITESLMQY